MNAKTAMDAAYQVLKILSRTGKGCTVNVRLTAVGRYSALNNWPRLCYHNGPAEARLFSSLRTRSFEELALYSWIQLAFV